MKIIPLGTGSAFTKKNFQSNFLIENNSQNLLVDAGTDIRFSLDPLNLSYKDIDALYVTHLHADHIGGIEYLAFCSYFDPSKKKIKLYGHQRVLDDLWNNSLKGGLRSIQGKVVSLEDYFDVRPLGDNGSFLFAGVHYDIVQSIHIVDGFSFVPSYGLMINDPTNTDKIYITSDAQHNPNQIADFYNQATYIIQDCETTPFKSGVHAHYLELATLKEETKKKMYLTHYSDNIMVDFEKSNTEAKNLGFKGFLEKGKVIQF